MTRFSANLGFLWTDRALPDAIRAAHAVGFDAVECHWPYDIATSDVAAALAETGLAMLGLNTRRGDVTAGENGLAALPGRADEARAAIDEALAYAAAIGAGAVHVMAGKAEGADARAVFATNLHYACQRAAEGGQIILIEPLNPYDAPGYFLNSTTQATDIITKIDALTSSSCLIATMSVGPRVMRWPAYVRFGRSSAISSSPPSRTAARPITAIWIIARSLPRSRRKLGPNPLARSIGQRAKPTIASAGWRSCRDATSGANRAMPAQ